MPAADIRIITSTAAAPFADADEVVFFSPRMNGTLSVRSEGEGRICDMYKNVRQFFFYNLKQLKPMFITFSVEYPTATL